MAAALFDSAGLEVSLLTCIFFDFTGWIAEKEMLSSSA
jgi:hypothetical protein